MDQSVLRAHDFLIATDFTLRSTVTPLKSQVHLLNTHQSSHRGVHAVPCSLGSSTPPQCR